MGSIGRFNISKMRQAWQLEFFFETGSFKGDGIAYALKSGYKQIYSTEIMDEYATLCRNRFALDAEVNVLKGNSFDCIAQVLPSIAAGAGVYWLDAHYPGADGGLQDYNHVDDEDTKYPLKREVEEICKARDVSRDVFVIDDLRMYELGDFQTGNLPEHIKRPSSTLSFLDALLGGTHYVFRLMDDQGYVVCLPKMYGKIDPFVIRKKGVIKRIKSLFGI